MLFLHQNINLVWHTRGCAQNSSAAENNSRENIGWYCILHKNRFTAEEVTYISSAEVHLKIKLSKNFQCFIFKYVVLKADIVSSVPFPFVKFDTHLSGDH